MQSTLQQLFTTIKTGDSWNKNQAWNALYKDHLNSLLRSALRNYTSSDYEDASQDALKYVYSRIANTDLQALIKDEINYTSYLFNWIKQALCEYWQHQKRQCRDSSRCESLDQIEDNQPTDQELSPSDQAAQLEEEADFKEVIRSAKLTELELKTMLAVTFDGMSYSAAAKHLHTNRKGIDNALVRVKTKINLACAVRGY